MNVFGCVAYTSKSRIRLRARLLSLELLGGELRSGKEYEKALWDVFGFIVRVDQGGGTGQSLERRVRASRFGAGHPYARCSGPLRSYGRGQQDGPNLRCRLR